MERRKTAINEEALAAVHRKQEAIDRVTGQICSAIPMSIQERSDHPNAFGDMIVEAMALEIAVLRGEYSAKPPDRFDALTEIRQRKDVNDQFMRSSIVIGKTNTASLDVISESGAYICRLNIACTPDGSWGNVDVIGAVKGEPRMKLKALAWKDGRQILNEEPDSGLIGVNLEAVNDALSDD